MDPSKEVSLEVPPYLRVYKDGTLERIAGTQVAPASIDPETGVVSKDIVIIPGTGVSGRLYRPNNLTNQKDQKLPLVVYFHGGAFCISSTADPLYHHSLNMLVADANIVVVSVNYRKVPEHPLPAAYEDSWAVLQWLASQALGNHDEPWLKDYADFGRLFLFGDSAGANIAHHMGLRVVGSDIARTIKILGIGLINPYFWGEKPIGIEVTDPGRKAMVDKWWSYVCPTDKGNDDPLINPFVDGSPSLAGLGCQKVLVTVAEKDILRDRGKLYYEKLVKSGWGGTAEIIETQGEDHDFHIFNPSCQNAKSFIKSLALFINQGYVSVA